MVVAGSSGSAGGYLGACAVTMATKSSATLSCTSTREGALQLWPWLKNMLSATVRAARSISPQSAKTRKADLPPSSL